MSDPFKIDGPTCFSFSTGRSSGYALRRTLDANDPAVLREHLKVLTCNTGKEDEASLRFGDRIDREWLRPLELQITWLEYREGAGFEVVTFESLSRNGEPFDAVIRQRGGVLPNPRSRYCSSELKTRTIPWADRKGIKRMYAEARRLTEATGIVHQVDHIIPLRGDMVSGLHVHNNLQILTGSENSKKRNRFEVEA